MACPGGTVGDRRQSTHKENEATGGRTRVGAAHPRLPGTLRRPPGLETARAPPLSRCVYVVERVMHWPGCEVGWAHAEYCGVRRPRRVAASRMRRRVGFPRAAPGLGQPPALSPRGGRHQSHIPPPCPGQHSCPLPYLLSGWRGGLALGGPLLEPAAGAPDADGCPTPARAF